MTGETGSILLAGETWISYGIHQKGFSAYTTGAYEEGQTEFVAALEATGWTVDHLPNHRATERFPWTATELSAYQVVILSDIAADTLLLHPDAFLHGRQTPNRLTVIADWVKAGGGFLMVGGYMSFSGFEGKAGYHRTGVPELLGVEMSGFDDRIEAPEGISPKVAAQHQVLAGLPKEWPPLLGYNRVRAIAGETLLTVGDDPLLVVAQRDAGRVAAFTSDCSPHWGSPDFVAWPGYGPFWHQLLRWLADGAAT